jgi:hypothetical protein
LSTFSPSGVSPWKRWPPLDDRHAQLLLELADAPGQRWLRHVAGLGRAREVLLAGQGGEILELADVHPCGACSGSGKHKRGQ